ncbi:MAG: zinc ribbon domain-containing protein [Promethearchaeota archaeon]
MGMKRVICSGCLGMLCLLPMAYISFRFLNLTAGVTGGLLENFEDALGTITGVIGVGGAFLEIAAGAFIGMALIFLFPIHWCIFYRPDDVGLIIAVTVPWILCCAITSGLFAHSPRGGVNTSLAIGIGYIIPLSIIYLVLAVAFPLGSAALDGLLEGLADLPFLLAIFTSIFEGCLVGAVFGAFIGSLKYKPGGAKAKQKIRKAKGEEEMPEPTLEKSEEIKVSATYKDDFCTNCGAKLASSDDFCTNCGMKRK